MSIRRELSVRPRNQSERGRRTGLVNRFSIGCLLPDQEHEASAGAVLQAGHSRPQAGHPARSLVLFQTVPTEFVRDVGTE